MDITPRIPFVIMYFLWLLIDLAGLISAALLKSTLHWPSPRPNGGFWISLSLSLSLFPSFCLPPIPEHNAVPQMAVQEVFSV